MAARVRTVFIGWGAINARVGALLAQRGAAVDIVGVATRSATPGNALPPGARHLTAPEELATLKPELVVEAAGRASVGQWAPAALAAAQEVIIASTSAFTDDDLLARLVAIAERHQSRIRVPSGAIGGIDALAGAATLALEDVLHQVVKPPRRLEEYPGRKADRSRWARRARGLLFRQRARGGCRISAKRQCHGGDIARRCRAGQDPRRNGGRSSLTHKRSPYRRARRFRAHGDRT